MTIHFVRSLLTLTNIIKLTTDIDKILPAKHLLNTALYSNNYIVEQNNYNIRNLIEYHNIRCWKSNCIFNLYLENPDNDNIIFSLDFSINKDDINNTFIKIDYMNINNDFYDKKDKISKKILLDDETNLIRISLLKFIENWAIKENIHKIIIDIHSNLERYNYELLNLGFIPNFSKKCKLNTFWIEAEKKLL
jgi:hypothetical protein